MPGAPSTYLSSPLHRAWASASLGERTAFTVPSGFMSKPSLRRERRQLMAGCKKVRFAAPPPHRPRKPALLLQAALPATCAHSLVAWRQPPRPHASSLCLPLSGFLLSPRPLPFSRTRRQASRPVISELVDSPESQAPPALCDSCRPPRLTSAGHRALHT